MIDQVLVRALQAYCDAHGDDPFIAAVVALLTPPVEGQE
jgi:hypothetical protein